MERESFGFPLGFTPRHYWQRMPGWEQVSRTLTRDYTFDINRTSISESTHNLRLRVAPPSRPRGSGALPAGTESPAGTRRFSAASPALLSGIPSQEVNVTRHHRGFTHVHPSGLPLACDPRMEQGPLGFFPELRTPPLPAMVRTA